jgi:hypothetical protein
MRHVFRTVAMVTFTMVVQVTYVQCQNNGSTMVSNELLPSSMRVGRYLADEQRLLVAHCSTRGDTAVIVWELRGPKEQWSLHVTFGDSTNSYTDLYDGIEVEHDPMAGYPQYRRLIVVTPHGSQAQSVSMVMRVPRLEAHSATITSFYHLDVH